MIKNSDGTIDFLGDFALWISKNSNDKFYLVANKIFTIKNHTYCCKTIKLKCALYECNTQDQQEQIDMMMSLIYKEFKLMNFFNENEILFINKLQSTPDIFDPVIFNPRRGIITNYILINKEVLSIDIDEMNIPESQKQIKKLMRKMGYNV